MIRKLLAAGAALLFLVPASPASAADLPCPKPTAPPADQPAAYVPPPANPENSRVGVVYVRDELTDP